MFDRARAECRSGEFGVRGYCAVFVSVLGTLATVAFVVAAIPPLRDGDFTWWSVIAVAGLLYVSMWVWVSLLGAWAKRGAPAAETRDMETDPVAALDPVNDYE